MFGITARRWECLAPLYVAGAAVGGVVGSVGAVQAGAVAMTAASTAYSVEKKSYKVVTIGVDGSHFRVLARTDLSLTAIVTMMVAAQTYNRP